MGGNGPIPGITMIPARANNLAPPSAANTEGAMMGELQERSRDMRDAFDCYALFEKHQEVFNQAGGLEEFAALAGLSYLKPYVGGWVERAFHTLKAGKKTCRGLILPYASKFSDLFTEAYFIPTDQKTKPVGVHFLSGNAGLSMFCGGTRGWVKNMPDVRSHYGAKFYGTYVVPIAEINYRGCSYEAIRREDGILILAIPDNHIGSDWVALLDLSESIESLYDETTKQFLAAERQAVVDAWGEK